MTVLKLFLILLTVLSLVFPAAAEPRFPERSGVVTDAAAVLSPNLLDDMRTLDSRLAAIGAPRLHIVTVDFLDATDVQSYADTLFSRWGLGDNDLLLLMCIGEETFAITCGANVNRMISPATQTKLLSTNLNEPFLRLEYDAAVSAFIPAIVREISKVTGMTVRTDDLFRVQTQGLISWASGLSGSAVFSAGDFAMFQNQAVGVFSMLRVVLIVLILLLVFGRIRRRRGQQQQQQQNQRFRRWRRH